MEISEGLTNQEGCLALEAILAFPSSQVIVTKRLFQSSEQTPSELSKNQSGETSLMEKIKQVWKEVLGVKEVELKSDFFALGGDSLTAIQLSYKLKTLLGITITPTYLLENSQFDIFISTLPNIS